MLAFLDQINLKILSLFGNYYLYVGFLVVLVSVLVCFLPVGRERLGHQKPEYSWFSWIALLYSTGMGSGLMLRAVQEPVYYQMNPPLSSIEPAVQAHMFSFYHWGFTPWAFYSLFGLILARKMHSGPALSLKSALTRNHRSVQFFTVLITLCGVVASLGLGASQFMGALRTYWKLDLGIAVTLVVILAMGTVATVSALSGLKRMIKALADFDMILATLLMVFVAFQIHSIDSISVSFHALRNYFIYFLPLSLNVGIGETSIEFVRDWTSFYWAFWLAWVPFTGLFIARVSRGRTIREFLVGTILIPSMATIAWFAVFATKAQELIKVEGAYDGRFNSVFTSIFIFLSELPLADLTIPVSAILVVIAIINSVDSSIYVLSSIVSDQEPSVRSKSIWGIIVTVSAIVLTWVGRDEVLGAVSNLLIIMALPFSVVYLWQILIFLKSLFAHKKT